MFKTCLISSVLIGANSIKAEEGEVHNTEEMLSSIHLEKKQVEKMVEKMVKSGRISVEEGEKARREIASIKDSDIEDLKNFAVNEIAKKN
jgi:polyhydroxyalkanoate synthesis regulator phasin